MSKAFPKTMQKLIEEFGRMPGVGPKSAERLAFYVLRSSEGDISLLLNSIREVKKEVKFCRICNNLSDGDVCSMCLDHSREKDKLCVVQGPKGVMAMEKSGAYNGLYHVLLGEISPIDGVGPDELKIDELVKRVKEKNIKEVIIATDFTTEGETTALYLIEVLKHSGAKVSRLARGVPVGAVLEYADVATLQRAFEERRGA